MATSKKPSGINLDAIQFPSDAVGLTRCDPKLTVSQKAAWLFGLGYPHGVFVTDEPIDTTITSARDFVMRYGRTGVMPREAVVRIYLLDGVDDDAEAREIIAHPKPPRLAAEIKALLKWGKAWQVWNLEAQFGSEAVATGLVDALMKEKPKAFQSKLDRVSGIIGALSYTLLRVPAKTAAALRKKLEARFKEVLKLGELWRPGEQLDLMLNGRKGVERSGVDLNGELYLGDLQFAHDDAAWALTQLTKQLKTLRPSDRARADPQFGVVFGAKAVKLIRSNLSKFFAENRKAVEAEFALFK